VGLGFMQYMRDYDEKNVLSGNWKPALFPYLKSHQIFECPSDNEYALNLHGSGIDLGVINNPTITPLVFDSTSTQPNAADFGTSYPQDGAHSIWKRGRGTNVLFFDGHVKWMQQKPVFKVLTPPIPSQKPKMKPKAQPKAARAR
jgi:prepilin-type processing-associated H-X9-DG protein